MSLILLTYIVFIRLVKKQLAYMLGRQQISLELSEMMDDKDDLREIIANGQLNQHFLTLAREVTKHFLMLHVLLWMLILE